MTSFESLILIKMSLDYDLLISRAINISKRAISFKKSILYQNVKNYRVSLPSRFPSFVVRPSPWMPPGFSRSNVLQTKQELLLKSIVLN